MIRTKIEINENKGVNMECFVVSAESLSAQRSSVGGKGWSLIQLHRQNVQVPSFLCISVSLFNHILRRDFAHHFSRLKATFERHGDASDLINELKESVSKISVDEIIQNIGEDVSAFLQKHKSASVRSSSLLEDADSKSYAGAYVTTLNCSTILDLAAAIRSCWVSQFQENAWRESFIEGSFDSFGMGVVLMKQIDSVKAGVCFTKNPITGGNEYVIEASFGQGEAVVSGMVVPDRFLLDADLLEILERNLGQKEVRVSLSAKGTFEEKNQSSGFCLSDQEVYKIARTSQEISRSWGPVDVEWAIDASSELWVLQARPITVIASQENLSWIPPEDGTWLHDGAHFPMPVARIFRSCIDEISRGWKDSFEHVGSLILTGKFTLVNDCVFLRIIPQNPENFGACFERGTKYIQSQGWKLDFDRWTSEICPAQNAGHLELKMVNVSCLNQNDFKKHFQAVMRNLRKSFYVHHLFGANMCTAIGWYLMKGSELTGQSHRDLLEALADSSRQTRGIWGEDVSEKIRNVFQGNPKAHLEVFSENATLEKLVDVDSSCRSFILDLMQAYDHFILGGFDGTQPTLRERPDVVLSSIRAALTEEVPVRVDLASRLEKLGPRAQQSEEFVDLLTETLRICRWRDERSLVNDAQALGLLRFALMEAWNRLPKKQVDSHNWELLLDCDADEIEGLLCGILSLDVEKLVSRSVARKKHLHIPPFLGSPPSPPPDMNKLPPFFREGEIARNIFIEHALLSPPPKNGLDGEIFGLGANIGRVEGRARILHQVFDLKSIEKGDIAVVEATNAAFNNFLPLFSGIGKRIPILKLISHSFS